MQRYRQIFFVLIKYGFDDLIHNLRVDQYLELGWNLLLSKQKAKVDDLTTPARMRLVLEELGTTFVKMGQALSTRSDLLDPPVLNELAKLQDSVPAFPSEKARAIIERELERDFGELFLYFEEKPMAAASIGQVHRAILRDGTEVAIKVQRPDISRTVEIDLEIMHHMASLAERHLELGHIHKPTAVIEEFTKSLKRELDYEIEIANLERFAEEVGDGKEATAPAVFREYSSSKVLTMAFVRGVKPSDVEAVVSAGHDPHEVAKRGARQVLTQVFSHGFFHADPHPGNIRIVDHNVICFLDFGMMGRLDRQSREVFADLLVNVMDRDEAKTAEALLKLTHSHALINRPQLEREIAELIDQYLYRSLKHLHVGRLVRDLLDLTTRFELTIPPQYFLLIKAITQVEDMGRRLDPEFDFTGEALPFMRKVILSRYNPKRLFRMVYESSSDFAFLMREVPGEVRELLKQAKQGKVKIEFQPIGLRRLLATLEHVSNRIASSIVLGSLIVGSSIIVYSGIPPKWGDIPIIGLGGYLVSGIMGFALLRAIAKTRKD